jgi:hypothetical protein
MSDDLEKTFKRVEKKIVAKIKEAAGLIQEANEMAKTIGDKESSEGLSNWDFWAACAPLRDALDEAGWSSSSMRC